MKREEGFGLLEMLISTALFLALLGAILSCLNDAMGLNEKAGQMADAEQNMRAGMNFMVQDFIQAGWGIVTGGFSIPNGTGSTPVKRPGPPGTNYTFAGATNISVIYPGAGLGPTGEGRATDMVNIVYQDNLLPPMPLTAIASDGSSMTVDAGTPISGIPNAVSVGDLIYFSNGNGQTVQEVTGVNGQVVSFATSDPMNLNQPGADHGGIISLRNGDGTWPSTTAYRIWMVTYYLDYTTDPATPRLIRRINYGGGQIVGLVLEDLQLSYDLVDGVTNPTNVKSPTAPYSNNQIRKVNIFLSGRTYSVIRNTNTYLRHSLTTEVSLRSLAFVNRYS
jgi:type II secretory pathway pseudopilin PulG